MNLIDLPEDELHKIKNQLIENGTIVKIGKVKDYDKKFFETVTISNILIKFFLFFSLGLYTVINLAGIVLSIVFNSDNLTNPLSTIVGVFVIDFIIFAIFNNVNTNKKKEEFPIYTKDDSFIFNFTDAITETPKLFYSLPYNSINNIEFLIYCLRKDQLFGSVTFTFNVLDYEVTHSIRFTNLTEIKQMLESKFPSLLDNLIIDGKKNNEPVKTPGKLKYILISLALLITSILLALLPIAFNYYSIALIASSVILFVSAIIVFLSSFLYLFSLVQGAIMSGIFIIMGFCIPLFIIENSSASFMNYIIQNNEILMLTIFGIIGLCLYAYIINIFIGKVFYAIKRQKDER